MDILYYIYNSIKVYIAMMHKEAWAWRMEKDSYIELYMDLKTVK